MKIYSNEYDLRSLPYKWIGNSQSFGSWISTQEYSVDSWSILVLENTILITFHKFS